ncbi:YhgE/Pip family protein [Leucobacter sp. UT-8R-CII-1-4]|uniref:YhgE/Pip family protein n=1 Tax=Leucobacter sp. UT-8R-CII-1-4 TaxID=3040075 RepID=UPI0024A814F7|nr:YhgE/Pip family protein [Leucobacter sp. UT-8R-CII-1-4]MDI6023544.1 YhgE/Pip family protein [Leucobacter sp. UT-8R-CII-1-4]
MSAGVSRLRGSKAVNWRTILGLLLVPLTAAGVLLWGLWNPTDRLETVTAAVVNLDEPVTVDGQMVPLGRVLAGELIDGEAETNFSWQLTDEEDAEKGLKDGRYATVVTIPENFSAAATSASKDVKKAQKATIDIQTSDRGRLLDSALSNIVTSTATSVLNAQLGEQFVGGVFVGMNEIGKGISGAADGATQLAHGGAALADGADQLASGANELASGTQQLASGTRDLATGTAAIAGGVGGIAAGAHGILNGDGSQGNPGLNSVAAQLGSYTAGVSDAVGKLQMGLEGAVGSLQQLRAAIEADLVPVDDKAAALAGLDQLIAGLTDPESAAQLEMLKSAGPLLSAGVSGYAGGLGELANGADQLAGGARQVSDGAAELAAGTPTLAAGTSQLAGGITGLADGAHKAADGSTELADGLHKAADEIPNYSKADRERLAELATKPVEAKGASDELFNAAGVPLFAGIALWAGAFASFLVLAPLWRRTREAARGVGYVTMRSAWPAAVIGAVQGAVVGAILPILMGYSFTQGLGFFGIATLAGLAFSLVNQGLSALLGGFGRFLSFALLVIAFAIGVISTAPPLLQAIGDASPIGALFDGFQAIAMGTGGAGMTAFLLTLWALAGLGLTALAVARQRKRLSEV